MRSFWESIMVNSVKIGGVDKTSISFLRVIHLIESGYLEVSKDVQGRCSYLLSIIGLMRL